MSPDDPAPRVLVIDDEKGLRDMLSHTLCRLGFRVSAAADGESGLVLAAAEAFDAVLCDIMMPGIGGVETLARLKRERPALQVVMATGYPTDETYARCMELGAFEYVSKPCALDELRAILEKAAARTRALRAA